jgi:hypothetical protein
MWGMGIKAGKGNQGDQGGGLLGFIRLDWALLR